MLPPPIAPGKRYTLPRPPGSADALLLARHAQAQAAAGRLLAVVTADPADALRLEDELRFFAPALRVVVFPDWETLPYDAFSPHQDLVSQRLDALWRLHRSTRAAPTPGDAEADAQRLDVLLVAAATALQRLAPPAFLAAYTFDLRQRQRLDEAGLKAQLTLAGYTHVSQVVAPGEYAVRGGLIDLYPMGSPVPYRVDLFGNEVDSIRVFDPDTQRSLYPVPAVRLLPGREFPLDEAARTAFRARWRERLDGDPTRSRLYKDIAQGLAGGGIEYYLPLFFEQTATLFDYLGGSGPGGAAAALVLHGEVDRAFERFWQDTRERHRFLQHDPERPILPPQALYLRAEEFYAATQAHPSLALRGAEPLAWVQPLPAVAVERGATEPLRALEAHLQVTPNRVLLVAESEGRRETLLDLLRDHGLEVPAVANLQAYTDGGARVAMVAAPLAAGFVWLDAGGAGGIEFITETELFASPREARRRRRQEQVSDVDALIKDLSELNPGDPVVHVNHGIGRYRGLVHIDLANGADGGASEGNDYGAHVVGSGSCICAFDRRCGTCHCAGEHQPAEGWELLDCQRHQGETGPEPALCKRVGKRLDEEPGVCEVQGLDFRLSHPDQFLSAQRRAEHLSGDRVCRNGGRGRRRSARRGNAHDEQADAGTGAGGSGRPGGIHRGCEHDAAARAGAALTAG